MKNFTKILLSFLAINSTLLAGCNKDKNKTKEDEGKILLSFGDVHATKARDITIQDLNRLVASKESFMLVVSTNTCGCWSEFEPNLNKYLADNKALCYHVDYNQIKDVASAYELYLLTSSTTTFAIFEDGKLKTSINSNDHKNIMNDEKTFKQYMSETIILPTCYFITKDDVSIIKESGKNAVVYFERTECGDCTAMNPGILRDYVKAHSNSNKLYVLDCQQYWRRSTEPDYPTYQETKDELGMSESTNPLYGYGNGVFPYFSYIENGSYASGAVIYNDSVTKEDNNYIVTDSYYTTERVANLAYTDKVIKGLTLNSEDVNESPYGVSWKHESADKFYSQILSNFLDYTLPKTTFNF